MGGFLIQVGQGSLSSLRGQELRETELLQQEEKNARAVDTPPADLTGILLFTSVTGPQHPSHKMQTLHWECLTYSSPSRAVRVIAPLGEIRGVGDSVRARI